MLNFRNQKSEIRIQMPYKEKEIEKLYYTIGEVSDMLRLNASQIRYWEVEFDMLKPRKDRGGNRIYTKDDIETIKLIHHLVKEKGFTIEGARTKLKNGTDEAIKKKKIHDTLKNLRDFLEDLKEQL
jgi:DNA-binding transcriptional MerR regulator